MNELEKTFLKDIKTLLLTFEYEDDKEIKMDTVDDIYRRVRDFRGYYCD